MSLTVLRRPRDRQLQAQGLAQVVDEPRILRQAVAADAHTRPQDVDVAAALRHRVGRLDDLKGVHSEPVAHLGQLVGQRDVEVDPEVVGKLDHLGGARVVDDHRLHPEGVSPQRGAGARAAFVDRTNHHGDRRQLIGWLGLRRAARGRTPTRSRPRPAAPRPLRGSAERGFRWCQAAPCS